MRDKDDFIPQGTASFQGFSTHTNINTFSIVYKFG